MTWDVGYRGEIGDVCGLKKMYGLSTNNVGKRRGEGMKRLGGLNKCSNYREIELKAVGGVRGKARKIE
jgi:hypothetical protein